ncbi:MAG: Gfo/Idh/MocA family oxidoreductase [Candidatus Omnitrophica bacterium]|nr:Gfo/Idh/MocA family oxidoreductase [Candidatus Omnitrophota bacterium]
MLKVAIIGCGYWGQNLIRNCQDTDGVSVVACVDARPDRLAYIRQRFPHVGLYDDWSRLVQAEASGGLQVDAVVVATPPSSHAALAKAALELGKHVLVEKPFTLRSEEAAALVALAKARGVRLMVDFTFVYAGAVRRIKELIDDGELGELYYFDSSRINLGLLQPDTNVVWDLVAHDVSMLLYLTGQHPIAVSAHGGSFIREGIPEIAYVNLTFPQGLMAHIAVSWLSPVKVRQTLIGGSKKMVLYDDIENIEKVRVYDKGVLLNASEPQGLLERQLTYRTGDVWVPKLDTTEPLKAMCAHFRDSIDDPRRVLLTDGQFGWEVVRILERVEASMQRRGQELRIETPAAQPKELTA